MHHTVVINMINLQRFDAFTDLLVIGHQHQFDVLGLRQDVPPPLQTDTGQRSQFDSRD